MGRRKSMRIIPNYRIEYISPAEAKALLSDG